MGVRRPGGGTLVVVESPAKARTVQRCLGPGYQVRATMGHLVDLPATALGIDEARGFEPRYELLKGKGRLLSELKRAAREAEQVLLATDPDREGEAIAWLLAVELGAPGGDERVRRVLLHDLTPEAVRAAVASPRDLDRRRFEAQQARRVLDRLVGWKVSPLLWRSVRRGLSAGRVQSVAVRLVVERERERRAFRPEERWGLEAAVEDGEGGRVLLRLLDPDGRPARLASEAEALAAMRAVEGADFLVAGLEGRRRELPPPPPFTTAALLQAAAADLGLSPRRAMALAQRLFEGLPLGDEGAVALLTYARTDSTRLSASAAEAIRTVAARDFGAALLAPAPAASPEARLSAHEAIRPTSVEWPPERAAPLLRAARERDLARLHRLVWDRTVASQLRPAALEEISLRVTARSSDGTARTFGCEATVLAEPGWLLVHRDRPPSPAAGGPPPLEGRRPPGLAPGVRLDRPSLAPVREPPAPPPAFTEASLVQALEARGLGRPSTFAAIVDTVQARGYVERSGRQLAPTALGERVTEALAEVFPRGLDLAFTAGLEQALDRIEEGTVEWRAVVAGLHGTLREAVDRADQARPGGTPAVACERCGRPMTRRWGRAGEFLACTGYPVCRNTRDPDRARSPDRDGKAAPSLGVACPLGCGGEVVERRSRRGQRFFGCTAWPACSFVSWDRPRGEPCPDCGGAWLVEVVSRRSGPVVACPDKTCGYRRPLVGADLDQVRSP